VLSIVVNSTKKPKLAVLIKVLVIFILTFSFFNHRVSVDGLIQYQKTTFLLLNKWHLTYLTEPNIPYLTELTLASIYKYLGAHIMNLCFGLAYIIGLFVAFKVYKAMGMGSEISTATHTLFN
jgi:hypothetical protein